LRTIPNCNTFLNHHRFLCQVCVFSPYDLRTESASTVRVKKHSDDRIISKYTRVQNSCSCYPAPWALFNHDFKTRQGPQENKKKHCGLFTFTTMTLKCPMLLKVCSGRYSKKIQHQSVKSVLKAVQRYKNDHWAVPRRPRCIHRRRRQRVK
jgi:hypothetical protein